MKVGLAYNESEKLRRWRGSMTIGVGKMTVPRPGQQGGDTEPPRDPPPAQTIAPEGIASTSAVGGSDTGPREQTIQIGVATETDTVASITPTKHSPARALNAEAGNYVVTGLRASIGKPDRPTLRATPNARIVVSEPDGDDTSEAKQISLETLTKLREELDGLRPFDRPVGGRDNHREVPLSGEAYQNLVAVVDAAIALHKSPRILPRVARALRELRDVLEEFERLLVTTGRVGGKLAERVLAAKEALDIVLAGLGLKS